MSFGWTITDPRYKQDQPWRYETFRGYFTDIQRAARKSLPRKPNKDLCSLLGLTMSPREMQPGVSKTDTVVRFTTPTDAPKDLVPVSSSVEQPTDPQKAVDQRGTFYYIKDSLLCRGTDDEKCTKREKTVYGVACYFAIVIFILLIIVVILASTLSRASEDGSGSVKRIGHSTTSTRSSLTTAHRPPTILVTTTSKPPSTTTRAITTTTLGERLTTTISSSIIPSSTKPTTISKTHVVSSSTTGLPKSTTVPVTSISTSLSSKTLTLTTPSPNTTQLSTVRITSSEKSSKQTESGSTHAQTTKDPGTSAVTKSQTGSRQTSTITKSQTVSKQTSAVTKSQTVSKTVYTTTRSSKPTTTSSPASSTTNKPTTNVSLTTTTVTSPSYPLLGTQTVQPSCQTISCNSARTIISRIDFTKSPCVDFYSFACGGWVNDRRDDMYLSNKKNVPQTVQEDLQQSLLMQLKDVLSVPYGSDESFSAKVTKRLYQYCIESNMDGNTVLGEKTRIKLLKELHAFLDPLGMAEDGSIVNTVPAMLYTAISKFQVTPFFKLTYKTQAQVDGFKQYSIRIEPPDLYLDLDTYLRPFNANEVAASYVNGMAQILYTYVSSFDLDSGLRKKRQATDPPDYSQIYQLALWCYNFEVEIAQIMNGLRVGRQTSDPPTVIVNVAYLKERYPKIPWTSALDVSRDQVYVELVEEMYFNEIHKFFNPEKDTDVKLYTFMAVLLKRVWMYLPFGYALRGSLQGIGNNGNARYTEIDCVNLAILLAKEEVHAIYINEYTKTVLEHRLQYTTIENKISSAFLKIVSSSGWIQPDLARVAKTIAKNVNVYFSPLKATLRQTLGIADGDQSLLSLCLELHKQKHLMEVGRLGKNVTVIEMDWASTRVYYDPTLNTIGLPTGLTVYLSTKDPDFQLHGYLGMLMAEEFVKILTGPLRGGVPPSWWGTSNIGKFDTVSSCFSDQLSQLQSVHYDIGEVIIQNGAFQLADQAYFTSSTSENTVIQGTSLTEGMLFLLSSVQLHCTVDDTTDNYRLLKQRLNSMLKNNVDMGVFACPVSSPMVGENMCQLF